MANEYREKLVGRQFRFRFNAAILIILIRIFSIISRIRNISLPNTGICFGKMNFLTAQYSKLLLTTGLCEKVIFLQQTKCPTKTHPTAIPQRLNMKIRKITQKELIFIEN